MTASFHIFVGPWSKFSECDKAKDFLTKQGISFTSLPGVEGEKVVTKIGDVELKGWDEAAYKEALKAAGFPASADPSKVNWFMTELILVILVIYVTMVYGPIAAFLVELFPARIRYTSMSLPYHIGNGWFGGMLPLLATAMVAASGNIYYRPVVPHRRGRDDLHRRHDVPQGNQGPQGARGPVSGQPWQTKPASAGFGFLINPAAESAPTPRFCARSVGQPRVERPPSRGACLAE